MMKAGTESWIRQNQSRTLHRTSELEVAAKLVGIRQVVAKEEGPQPLLITIFPLKSHNCPKAAQSLNALIAGMLPPVPRALSYAAYNGARLAQIFALRT